MKATAAPAEERPANPWHTLTRGWNRFWFLPADPTPLGLIRVFAGLVTFYVILAYTVDLQEFFGPHAWVDAPTADIFRKEIPYRGRGFKWDESVPLEPPRDAQELSYIEKYKANPRQVAAKGIPVWSVWFHVTDPTAMAVVHGLILAVVFLFTIGCCTRVTAVLTWLGVISYTQRAPTTVFGADTMMNLVLLYLMIGPSGAALSVDRLVARYRATRRALRGHRPAPATLRPAPSVSANLALRLIQVNLCIIYLIAGLSKLEGKAWWSGTATWGTMANPEFSPMNFPPYLNFLRFLAENRALWEVCMTAGVVFTLFTEIGFAFLIWHRGWRWVYLTCAALFHTGIAVFMGLNTFGLFMLAMLLAFVPLETVHRFLRWLGKGAPRLRLEVGGLSPGQVRVASLARAFDAWDQVEVIEPAGKRNVAPVGQAIHTVGTLRPDAAAGDVGRAVLTGASGEAVTGYFLFERLTRSLRLLWPVAALTWVPGVATLGKKWYPGEARPALVPPPGGNGKVHVAGEAVAR